MQSIFRIVYDDFGFLFLPFLMLVPTNKINKRIIIMQRLSSKIVIQNLKMLKGDEVQFNYVQTQHIW